jgi:ribosomal protein S18 acetylase RimI-like enzyme
LKLLIPGYTIRQGSILDRALLVNFMQRTYEDVFPGKNFSHLVLTVDQYFSQDTPLWWVEEVGEDGNIFSTLTSPSTPIACLWLGNVIDQVSGKRHGHIFLLYVIPQFRRRGIGKALMNYAEEWAIARGDSQIGLQVFSDNQAALNLYSQIGYQTQSLWMLKNLKK